MRRKKRNGFQKFPLLYYDVNVYGTLNLLQIMDEFDCKKLIFSSSASVYGKCREIPNLENINCQPISVYGRTKLICENLIKDWVNLRQKRKAIILRYYNPVGNLQCLKKNTIINKNAKTLFNYIEDVISKKQKFLKIYGNNFNTPDGTCIRDYIHMSDLIMAHTKAIKFKKPKKH